MANPAACPDCKRPANAEPASRRQRRCACAKKPAAPTLLRPMLPVSLALADALDSLGWDGRPDTFSFPIISDSGIRMGDMTLLLAPHSYVVVDGRIAPVTPEAFLGALRFTLGKAQRPAEPAPAVEPLDTPGVAVLDAEDKPHPNEPLARHRTPWPWENS